MKAAIIGASGLVGSHLMTACKKRNWDVIGTYAETAQKRQDMVSLQMTDVASVKQFLESTRPEVVFLVAFLTNVDYCELHPEETWKINVQGNKNVIDIATGLGMKIVYYSSDYIFDGKAGPYSEIDKPNPICEYGRQKLAVEKIVQEASAQHLIIRTTIVYGWEEQRKNFFCQVINTLGKEGQIKVPDDQIGTPTFVEDLARASYELAEMNTSGTIHVAGPDRMSRYSFALAIAQIFGLRSDLIIPVRTSKLIQAAKRPLSAGLECGLLRRKGIKFNNTHTSLRSLQTISNR